MICKTCYKWTKTVKEIDNYTCQECGTSTGRMVAHHIIPMDYDNPWSKESDFDTDNGICLCIRCHNRYHHIGKTLSEETKKKISILMTGENHWDCSGENHPMYSKNHSEETKKKMSISKSGENHPMYSKNHSEETKKKMSISKSGENHPMFGKHHSEDSKKIMSEKKKGIKRSEETKRKIKEIRKWNKWQKEMTIENTNPMYSF